MTELNSTEFLASWLGSTAYSKALSIQDNWSQQVRDLKLPTRAGIVLGLEHPAVITLGRRGNSSDLLGVGEIEVVEVDRGGQATLHSPGQLVIYPILHLRHLGLSVRRYVELLEESTISMLKFYGIESLRGCHAGVFTNHGKIAFVGVRVDRGVTRHGISINVFNDLGAFAKIKACGVLTPSFDRMLDHKVQATLQEAFDVWSEAFSCSLKAHRAGQLAEEFSTKLSDQ